MAEFQSTRPLRGATRLRAYYAATFPISIHAPLAGRDVIFTGLLVPMNRFQSTRPLRGATRGCAEMDCSTVISIHAPLAGRDCEVTEFIEIPCDFHPRAPCGARLSKGVLTMEIKIFQSTRPLRGATAMQRRNNSLFWNFNPRAPCGARRSSVPAFTASAMISIHAPLAGRDWLAVRSVW